MKFGQMMNNPSTTTTLTEADIKATVETAERRLRSLVRDVKRTCADDIKDSIDDAAKDIVDILHDWQDDDIADLGRGVTPPTHSALDKLASSKYGSFYDALKGFFKDNLELSDFVSTLDNPNGIISSDKVGASIASDIQRSAIISIILALIIIFAYIAMRFKGWNWGLGGVVSLAHTAIILIGFFSLFSGILPFNLDVDQTFIAAILTIIGYAINDNVVIFDRIRENLGLHPNDNFKDQVNKSLNQTLTRTVNTSVSTLLPMLAIAIFGGESIRGLSVALCLGICIGTYASIMIGTPIMYDSTIASEKKKALKK